MRTFTTYIEYLLMTRHYCYVPGRGAYMLVDEPATQGTTPSLGAESRRLYNMEPPHRIVRFTPLHSHDDGMLANLLMEAEGMSYDEASRYIQRQAPLLTDDFTKSASLHTDIENFGFDNLQLETWADIESRLTRIEQVDNAGNTVAASSDTPTIKRADTIEIPKYWLKRVAVVLLIGIFFFTNFIGLNESTAQLASVIDLNSMHRNTMVHQTWDEEDELIDLEEQEIMESIEDSLIEAAIAEAIAETAIEPHPELVATVPVSPVDIYFEPEEEPIQAVPSGTNYFIIVGCTRSQDKANEIFERYHNNGFDNVGILVTKDLYRVFINQFAGKDEAVAYLREIRKVNDKLSKSWMLPFENDGSLSSYIIKNIYNDNQLSMELSHPYQRTERDQG